ncbi:hypothetical protein GCM10023081_24980 [Arthrobacter ginkgonis]|uniref:Uncharacterized protein n=1 Tax=Arthrobacter ginkgonis TaxID=1630594 RepID=A0ABP7CF99_9MICC
MVLALPIVLVAVMMVATGEWGALAVLVPVVANVAAAALLLRGTVVAGDDGVRVCGGGPALVVRRRSGSDRIYSVATREDAQRMAALLNRRAGKNQ